MRNLALDNAPTSLPRAATVVELLKPITWFAPMWAFGCGVVSAGVPPQGRWLLIAGGVVLAGPLVCGTSQAVNDWFDRHVDAINEPERPIPSGRMPGRWGLYVALAGTLLGLLLAGLLGPLVLAAAALALLLAWAYSAPPVRLKRDGWAGNSAVALCYEGLPWITGAAIMAGGLPQPRILIVALLYSIGAHGIMTLNDFKSVAGDRRLGIATVPVRLGVAAAARLACAVMAAAQLVVVGLLAHWGLTGHALAVAALLLVQLGLMARLLAEPRARAPWYNATGTTLYVAGMLVTAFALAGGTP